MTRKEKYCLFRLLEAPQCSWDISEAAIRDGENTTQCRWEWADAPLRSLRAAGLARRTGAKSRGGRAIHEITDAGRVALNEEDA